MLRRLLASLFQESSGQSLGLEESTASTRYAALRRNLVLIMLGISILPLLAVSIISHIEARQAMQEEALAPLKRLVNKTKHSFELFLAERNSAVSFIASAYSFETLSNQARLESIFAVMRKEFGGFVDLGLIDPAGRQVSYVGPYNLEGKQYEGQEWFQEVMVKGTHISDVFLGHRSFPHFVIAVKHSPSSGGSWILRATINTDRFMDLIDSMNLDARSEAIILNREGVLQTNSSLFGSILSQFPLELPRPRSEAQSISAKVSDKALKYLTLDTYNAGSKTKPIAAPAEKNGSELLLVQAAISNTPFVLVLAKPYSVAMETWQALQSRMLIVFITSLIFIAAAVFAISTRLVARIQTADLKREAALHNMEHANKLASVGRLAAGVAHEINNPLAIINEKAGLMEDFIKNSPEMPNQQRFLRLTDSIVQSVERCGLITHRLLGFAKRMDVSTEMVDLNEVLLEVMSFLDREAEHRKIELRQDLGQELPRIESDHGQLQQVFLNLLNNALDAVGQEGMIVIRSYQPEPETISVDIEDNGCGMTKEVQKRIFEPFFTTRGAAGTGLGLSITYGLVQRLGGKIDLQSEEGKGTTFTVRLPLKPPKQEGM
jgi:two-component system NtrC family sensor kinase